MPGGPVNIGNPGANQQVAANRVPAAGTAPTAAGEHSGSRNDIGSTTVTTAKSVSNLPILWNPPPHRLTRPPRISWNNYDPNTKDTAANINLRRGVGAVPRFGRLGALYTDDFTAQAASTLFSTNRYGCQFHYNPTSLSYGASSDMGQVNPLTQGTDPNGLVLPGTVNMSFELYFNRIYDLATGTDDNQYERPLRRNGPWYNNEALGIQEKGTEFDIEFLYRSVNGDPQTVRHTDRKTADFGFMMRNLLRLRIGSFQYIGFINSISVNHILFTEEMVPTFSSVTINFDRQVTLGGNDQAAGFQQVSDLTGGASTSPNTGGN